MRSLRGQQERRGEESEPHPPQKQNQTKGIAAAALRRLATIYHRRSAHLQGRSSNAQWISHGEGIEDPLGIARQPCNRQPNGDANPPAHALHVELERRNFFFFPRIIEFFPVYVCVAACAHVRAEACFVPWALKGPLLFLLLLLLLLLLRISVAEWRVFFEKWFRSRRTFNATRTATPSVLPLQSSLVLCKRRKEQWQRRNSERAGEQADRQLDNGSRLGKIRGKQEREKRARE